jgi:cytochrome bd ubiquinol oxidase subunit I
MIDNIDPSLVDWSRAQFALTAMYHWLFVPLTLGLSFIVAFMETMYVRTGSAEWKRITKFWMTLFGINFAIGVATGIILEFEFGTNWSNYSWFVGDIFGAPLAIEGIMAFFLESTFVAVMFFGWHKVSPKFHLISTWLVAIGANLSALWILVANGWMQNPVGMHFNPETARNEMINFWDVLFSPMAVYKFLHTISSGFMLASVFVLGISAWFLLKKRDTGFAKRSMIVAGIFGLLAAVFTAFSGDSAARLVATKQPMKFAAFEGLYDGSRGASLMAFGVVSEQPDSSKNYFPEVKLRIEVPNLLSYLAYLDPNAFVPGVNDLIKGNVQQKILSAQEKIERGKVARNVLKAYKDARDKKDAVVADVLRQQFNDPKFQDDYFKYFGYGFLNDTKSLIPNVPLSFYSFHIMVFLGFYFIVIFILVLYYVFRGKIENKRKFLWLLLFSIPLVYIASQCGWIVAEVGRQPWVIQDYLPTVAAVSQIDASAVQVTFWMFFVVFTALMIAEISIMTKQIKIGPKEEGENSHV